MIVWGFLIGQLLCGLGLALLKSQSERMDDKFGSAVAAFSLWCAFGMLMMAGTYGLGLLVPGLVGAAVLMLRTAPVGRYLTPLAGYKIHLGLGALVASVVTWLGVLNLIEELPNG